MRALKVFLILLGSLLALLLLLAAMSPAAYRYERSVRIEAPPGRVYPNIATLEAMDRWSPWNERDPGMRKTYEGTDGHVGAVQRWEGNKDVGKGLQRIAAIEPGRSVTTDLEFIEPWASKSTAEVSVTAEGEGSRVTWALYGENDLLGRIFGLLMDMDAMLGKDFEHGLAMLKAQVEEREANMRAELAAKTMNGFVIETVTRPETVYVGKRDRTLKWDAVQTFYASVLPMAFEAAGKAGLAPAGHPSGVYFLWDEKNKLTDLFAGVPIAAAAEVKVPGVETLVVPASRMLHIAYYGDYAGIGAAHEAMDAMIAAKGLDHYGNVIEEYVTDPTAEPDTTKWLTNVYYMVR